MVAVYSCNESATTVKPSRMSPKRWGSPANAHTDGLPVTTPWATPGCRMGGSRPHTTPTRTSPDNEQRVLDARVEHRKGQDWLGAELGIAPRTVSRILRRHDAAYLCDLDPLTGEVIRSSKATAIRYERERPGELVHMDVKKIGRIPDGGGWRAHGREMGSTSERKNTKIGYDYVHSVVDDHSRVAFSEILADERADTTAAFFARAIECFAAYGVTIERLITDNAWSYRHANTLCALLAEHGIKQQVHPTALSVAERQSRTLQPYPRHRVGLPASVHQQRRTRRRVCALAPVQQ